jgi:alkanesulfonate monooxygenase SsuD/methylene tetrahydromethanopterin reductase-like flavin-dependent oxidoreductase (luciferase family)
MPPNFNPGNLGFPDPAIFIGAVNANVCQLAGELCDGIFLHPLTSPKYLEQVIWPSLEKGAKKSGRSLTNFEVMGGGFTSIVNSVDMGIKSRDEIKQRISFYASARTYQPMLAIHGWQDLTSGLHEMSRQGQWKSMASLITDEMVETFAIVGTSSEVIQKLHGRWVGIANGITISIDLLNSISQNDSTEFIREIHSL